MTTPRRLFVAIEVGAAHAALGAEIDRLARRATNHHVQVRWMVTVDLHLTLKYLGWTRAEALPAVIDTIDRIAAAATPFGLVVGGLGGFPSVDAARVLWAGVADADGPAAAGRAALLALAARAELELVELGFAPEPRPFSPHITLGRLPEARGIGSLVADPVAPAVTSERPESGQSAQMFSTLEVQAITLYESPGNTTGSGKSAGYRKVHRAAFGHAQTGPGRQGGGLETSAHRTASSTTTSTTTTTSTSPSISTTTTPTTHARLGAYDRELDRIDTDDGWAKGQGPSHDDPFAS
ncbi:MAG: RNA 2',3'-cyclic phosphodiesterase [Kofleriaceae bacterium]|nr:RNA 2',3'-cyclic phosphodiesterase [Kofleriaceae bacterium]MBP6839393.1 RNA 2',3'-cyclic phosphodiesterase [Kofleriaceae bacterium]MBP9203821.1 RNA 2',3'-cyclic phosphodiesterase [Kofleriaceae bacterium]